MTTRSLDDWLTDRALLRAISLQWYANSEVRAVLRLLNAVDTDLVVALLSALERLPAGSFTVRRLDSLLSGVWELNDAVYRTASLHTAQQMRGLVGAELEHQARGFREFLPDAGSIRIGVPPLGQVYAAVTARPFRGRLLAEWFTSLAAGRQQRISDTLRSGYVQGLTVDEMVRTLRGTRAERYADGILQIDRRHAEAVVRTAVAHTAAVAREQFLAVNAPLVKEVRWLSTLDNRTTDLCIVRDGLHYSNTAAHTPVGGHAMPWLEGPGAIHWGCRSVSVPVIDAEKELGLKLPPLRRAAAGGTVAEGTTYRQWLTTQPQAVQDQVLGKQRAALFRSGAVGFDRFFNDRGQFRTLAELAK